MIVIAIIGILAAVAVPQYSQYTKRAKFSEVKLAVSPIKTGVEVCFERNAGNSDCADPTSGINGGVTAAMLTRAASAKLVASVGLGAGPVITATSANDEGFTGQTYVITADVVAATGTEDAFIQDWVESGTGCTAGWC